MAFRNAFRTARTAGARAARSIVAKPRMAVGAAVLTGAGLTVSQFTQVETQCASTLVDVSCLTKVTTGDEGLLPQPTNPDYKFALVEIFVPDQKFGGSDKSNNGHRYDSICMANGMISSNMSCQLINYVPAEHDKFMSVIDKFDAVIVRCNPGQIGAAGGNQQKFDEGMRTVRAKGIPVWPSPDVMEMMGAKDALCKIANLSIGLEDTLAYYSPEEFAAGFKKTMAFQPRVVKQNRGSSGEGIWIIKLQNGDYCKGFGDRSCSDDEVLEMMEACDNHAETHTVAEFVEFCINGRNEKSGTWTTIGTGKYLEGGKEAGGQLVDQRFCPRIVEGEVRINMVADVPVGIIHKKPKEGGISAVGGTGSIYTYYATDAPEFAELMQKFLTEDLPPLMAVLGLPDEPLPLWWTGDFIPVDKPDGGTRYIVGEFNCSCVGISQCGAAYCTAAKPNQNMYDVVGPELTRATFLGNLMGTKAKAMLDAQNASVSDSALKVITRIEALQGAVKMGVLSEAEAKCWLDKVMCC